MKLDKNGKFKHNGLSICISSSKRSKILKSLNSSKFVIDTDCWSYLSEKIVKLNKLEAKFRDSADEEVRTCGDSTESDKFMKKINKTKSQIIILLEIANANCESFKKYKSTYGRPIVKADVSNNDQKFVDLDNG